MKAHKARTEKAWPFLLGLAVLVSVTFWNSQSGVFLFDDFASVHQNATIRELWPPWLAFSPPGRGESVSRPSTCELDARPQLRRRRSRGPRLPRRQYPAAPDVRAVGVRRRAKTPAARRSCHRREFVERDRVRDCRDLAVHPLQTEVVNYIVARTESLMAACYLLCLYASVRAPESPGRQWNIVAILAAGLGMLCKESMATIPVAVVLIDRAVLFPSFADAFPCTAIAIPRTMRFVADPGRADSSSATSEFCGFRCQK